MIPELKLLEDLLDESDEDDEGGNVPPLDTAWEIGVVGEYGVMGDPGYDFANGEEGVNGVRSDISEPDSLPEESRAKAELPLAEPLVLGVTGYAGELSTDMRVNDTASE